MSIRYGNKEEINKLNQLITFIAQWKYLMSKFTDLWCRVFVYLSSQCSPKFHQPCLVSEINKRIEVSFFIAVWLRPVIQVNSTPFEIEMLSESNISSKFLIETKSFWLTQSVYIYLCMSEFKFIHIFIHHSLFYRCIDRSLFKNFSKDEIICPEVNLRWLLMAFKYSQRNFNGFLFEKKKVFFLLSALLEVLTSLWFHSFYLMEEFSKILNLFNSCVWRLKITNHCSLKNNKIK